jgi:hypothetical protein
MGAYEVNLTDFDHTCIRDYDWFDAKWQDVKDLDPVKESMELGTKLRRGLNIDIADLDSQQSRFFKTIYINPPRPLIGYEQIKHLSANHV